MTSQHTLQRIAVIVLASAASFFPGSAGAAGPMSGTPAVSAEPSLEDVKKAFDSQTRYNLRTRIDGDGDLEITLENAVRVWVREDTERSQFLLFTNIPLAEGASEGDLQALVHRLNRNLDGMIVVGSIEAGMLAVIAPVEYDDFRTDGEILQAYEAFLRGLLEIPPLDYARLVH